MRVLLFPVGSSGDVFPFIAIGLRLKERGHDVTICGNGHFAKHIARVDLPFIETESAELYEQMQNEADLWHPIRSFKKIFGHPEIPNAIRLHYRLIAERFVPGETVVVGGSLAFGPRIARERLGVPLVTVHLQPALFKSIDRTAVYAGGGIKPWWPRWLKRFMFWVGDRFMVDPIIAPVLNAFRADLGLPPAKRILTEWIHSPDRVIGMFPEWFGAMAADWPPQTRLAGFPLYDGGDDQLLAENVQEFLEAGSPPVVVTFGSAMRFAKPYFTAAVAALHRLGKRGILLTPFRDQVPAPLPKEIAHFDYVRLGQLLPRACCLIHHGGIGTSSQGLAAGVPQLVMPLAHDQPDNAHRLVKLGVGRTLKPRRFNARNVARELLALETDTVRQCCRQVVERFVGADPLTQTCELIEETAKRTIVQS